MIRQPYSCCWSAALILLLSARLIAAERDATPPRRAKPPVWSQEVVDVFFDDARQHLVGTRPAASSPEAISQSGAASPAAKDTDQGQSKWSQLIEADALATEVKRLAGGLRLPLANATRYKSGGYKQCADDFGLLAVLFAVIAEYDREIRWHDAAPSMRDALAQAARGSASHTEQDFAQAQRCREDLEAVVGGQPLTAPRSSIETAWSELTERSTLMRRMELSLRERIAPDLADAKRFAKSQIIIQHEAELLAVLAEVIHRPEFDYWDDAGFQRQAHDLGAAAVDLAEASAGKNYEGARGAADRVGRACAECHANYRG